MERDSFVVSWLKSYLNSHVDRNGSVLDPASVPQGWISGPTDEQRLVSGVRSEDLTQKTGGT